MLLELGEKCRYITVFITHDGVYLWRSLPFGLATGSAAFQETVRTMLDGLTGCANILDDVIVFGRDIVEHDRHLRGVVDRLAKYGATL